MKSTQNLPQRLKELRNQHHYSQEQLAEILNVTRQAVSRWENGKAFPDIDNLLLLTELYGITIDELLDVQEKNNKREDDSDNLTTQEVSPLFEISLISIIVVLSANLPCIGIIVTIGIIVRSIYTKRHYKIVYVLCTVSLGLALYEILIIYMHFVATYGQPFVFSR